jgi:hypothetical protein
MPIGTLQHQHAGHEEHVHGNRCAAQVVERTVSRTCTVSRTVSLKSPASLKRSVIGTRTVSGHAS